MNLPLPAARCFLLVAALASSLRAQPTSPSSDKTDIRLNDGTVFHSARIAHIAGANTLIVHKSGVTTVATESVPLDLLAQAHLRITSAGDDRQATAQMLTQADKARRQTVWSPKETDLPQAPTRSSERMTLLATGQAKLKTPTPENGCVFASNSGGVGTGFVVRQADGFVLVSNQHVIDGGAPHRFTLPGGAALKPTGGFLADDRDIAVFDLEEGSFAHYFEMEPDVDSVPLGEELIIYGNAKGDGIRLTRARLVAKSPTQIEVSGGIVSGNSGGPILRAKTGRVIAVSTSASVRRPARTTREIIEDAVIPKVQFYGARIDAMRRTTSFNFGAFVADSANVDAEERRLHDAVRLLALMIDRQQSRKDTYITGLAKEASPDVRALAALRASDPFLFRQRSAQLFREVPVGGSYIHRERRENLRYRLERLRQLFHEIAGIRD